MRRGNSRDVASPKFFFRENIYARANFRVHYEHAATKKQLVAVCAHRNMPREKKIEHAATHLARSLFETELDGAAWTARGSPVSCRASIHNPNRTRGKPYRASSVNRDARGATIVCNAHRFDSHLAASEMRMRHAG